ncbi:hypothetical protein BGZ70_004222, partial [Mortierella alpina]
AFDISGSSSSSSAGYGLRQIPERSEHNSPVLDASADVDGGSSVDEASLLSLSETSSAHHHHHQQQQQQQQQYAQQPRRYLHRSGSESLGKGGARTLRSVLEGSSSHAGERESVSTQPAYTDVHSRKSSAEESLSSAAELTPLQRMQQQLNVGQQHQQQLSKQHHHQQQQHHQRYHFGYPQSESSNGGNGTGGSSSGVDSNSSSRQDMLSEPDFETEGGRFGQLDLGSSQRSCSGTDGSLDNSSNSDSSSGSSSSSSSGDEGEVEEMQELDGLGFVAERRVGSGLSSPSVCSGSHSGHSVWSRSVEQDAAECPPLDAALGTTTASLESPDLSVESSFCAPTAVEQALSKVEEADEEDQLEVEDNDLVTHSAGNERKTTRLTHVLVDDDGSGEEEVAGTAAAGRSDALGLRPIAEEREGARQPHQGQGQGRVQRLDQSDDEGRDQRQCETFCLGHRHPADHACPQIEERKKAAEEEVQRKKAIQDAVADKFLGTGTGTDAGNDHARVKNGTPLVLTAEEKQGLAKAKAEAAKAAIAEARAKVAARGTGSMGAAAAGSGVSTASGVQPDAAAPKVKKASRVVALIKMKKMALGDDKIPLSSRLYVHIKSPLFPHLDDKAVFIDKRFSIFSAKESDGLPTLLGMQDRLQQLTQVVSGDIFYLAPADWPWKQQ